MPCVPGTVLSVRPGPSSSRQLLGKRAFVHVGGFYKETRAMVQVGEHNGAHRVFGPQQNWGTQRLRALPRWALCTQAGDQHCAASVF